MARSDVWKPSSNILTVNARIPFWHFLCVLIYLFNIFNFVSYCCPADGICSENVCREHTHTHACMFLCCCLNNGFVCVCVCEGGGGCMCVCVLLLLFFIYHYHLFSYHHYHLSSGSQGCSRLLLHSFILFCLCFVPFQRRCVLSSAKWMN